MLPRSTTTATTTTTTTTDGCLRCGEEPPQPPRRHTEGLCLAGSSCTCLPFFIVIVLVVVMVVVLCVANAVHCSHDRPRQRAFAGCRGGPSQGFLGQQHGHGHRFRGNAGAISTTDCHPVAGATARDERAVQRREAAPLPPGPVVVRKQRHHPVVHLLPARWAAAAAPRQESLGRSPPAIVVLPCVLLTSFSVSRAAARAGKRLAKPFQRCSLFSFTAASAAVIVVVVWRVVRWGYSGARQSAGTVRASAMW